MNLQDVYEFMDRFEASALTEVNLEMEGMKFSGKKGGSLDGNFSGNVYAVKSKVNNAGDVSANLDANKDNSEISGISEILAATGDSQGTEIKAKVAGTFYRAESPESKPFIQVGDKVKNGDVIGMIEAMKMMNNICSPVDGTVVDIRVSNEELVGFDDVIAVIEED